MTARSITSSWHPIPIKIFTLLNQEIAAKKADPDYSLIPMTTEGCVVRMADTIAYIGRDLEDAIRWVFSIAGIYPIPFPDSGRHQRDHRLPAGNRCDPETVMKTSLWPSVLKISDALKALKHLIWNAST
jgi:hypothetical protein